MKNMLLIKENALSTFEDVFSSNMEMRAVYDLKVETLIVNGIRT